VPSNTFDQFLEEHWDSDSHDAVRSYSAVVCLATPGVPVLYVSDAFEAHTGYSPQEVIGRGLTLLQGPDTEAEAVSQFRDLIQNGEAGTVRITNYRKDGARFIHECELRPVHDDSQTVTHFIAIQRPV